MRLQATPPGSRVRMGTSWWLSEPKERPGMKGVV